MEREREDGKTKRREKKDKLVKAEEELRGKGREKSIREGEEESEREGKTEEERGERRKV